MMGEGGGERNILCSVNGFFADITWHTLQIAGALGMRDFHLGNLYVGGCPIKQHLAHLHNDAPAHRFYELRGGEWEFREGVSIGDAVRFLRWDWICIQHGTKGGSRYSNGD